jgi:hypothetical protein
MPGFHFSLLSVKFGVAAMPVLSAHKALYSYTYVGWNFNSGNYLFKTDTK